MTNTLIPTNAITSATIARVLNDADIAATAPLPDVVMAPGPGTVGIHGFGSQSHLSFTCRLEFAVDASIEDRQRLAHEVMRVVPGVRAYINDQGMLMCTIDLMVEHGVLPTQVVYTYRALISAMEALIDISDEVLRA